MEEEIQAFMEDAANGEVLHKFILHTHVLYNSYNMMQHVFLNIRMYMLNYVRTYVGMSV